MAKRTRFPPVEFVPASSDDAIAVESKKRQAAQHSEAEGKEVRDIYERVLSIPPTAATGAASKSTRAQQRQQQRKRRKRAKPDPLPGVVEIHQACESGDLGFFAKWFERGSVIDWNVTDAYGWTPLMTASSCGQVGVVSALLQHTDVDISVCAAGKTAAAIALAAGHQTIAQLLNNVSATLENRKEEADAAGKEDVQGNDKDETGRGRNSDEQASSWYCDVCKSNVATMKDDHVHSIPHLVSSQFPMTRHHFVLPPSNKGYRLMVKGGWGEEGLGPVEAGKTQPVKTFLKRDRMGLGFQDGSNSKSSKKATTARVTHFGPGDQSAVKLNIQPKVPTKKDLLTRQERDKIKEAQLRRYMST